MAKIDDATTSRFEGFADREARFFRALAKNQSREWFAEHRDEYQVGWLEPMRALLAEVRARLAPAYRREDLGAPKVFRIHRDVRFSKDKSPYKTHIGGYLPIDGTSAGPGGAAALYFHVAADELFACAGQYVMDGDQLKRFRAAILDPKKGKELTAMLATLRRKGFGEESREQLQRVPRGIDPQHPHADLLRRKGLIMVFPAAPRALLVSRKLVDELVRRAKETVPLVEWLSAISV
jgi:uncharacterized protein (TIGR02453 family)